MAAAASGRPRRLVVVGGSGLIGRHLVAGAGGLECIATYARHPRPGGVRYDLCSDELTGRVPDLGPDDCVVLLAGEVDQARVLADPAAARALNVDGSLRCARSALARGARLVFMSSEAVFAGDRPGGYDELARPDPVSAYGRMKAEVEAALQSRDGRVSIVRTGWVVAPEEARRCPVAQTLQALRGPDARMATDNELTVTAVEDLVAGLLAVIRRPDDGVFHLAANPPVTRAGLADQVRAASAAGDRLGYRAVRFAELSWPEPRPRATWLNSRRTCRRLGLSFRPPARTVADKVARLERGAPADWVNEAESPASYPARAEAG